MNQVQKSFLEWLLANVTAATVKALLVDTDYTYSAAHDFLDDVTAGSRVGSAVTVTGLSVASAEVSTDIWETRLIAGSGVSFSSVTNTENIQGVWLYLDAGSDATRRLMTFYDRKSDGATFEFDPDGGTVIVTWSTTKPPLKL